MSLQKAKSQKFLNRLARKLHFMKLIDFILFSQGYLQRKMSKIFQKSDYPKVFFPYLNHYSHPDIKRRFFGKNAPLKWSVHNNSRVQHFLQYEQGTSNNCVIIEPNDHILTVGSVLGLHRPSEQIDHLSAIESYLQSEHIRYILVGEDALMDQAKYYFSQDVLQKIRKYSQFACNVKVTELDIDRKLKTKSHKDLMFLCIASSYELKAVDLILAAFSKLGSNAKLILVCHDLPPEIRQQVVHAENIELIEAMPLSNKLKHSLYAKADIFLNITHLDSWGAAIMALEYGLPIISSEYHRGKGLVGNENGFIIKDPLMYYSPGQYGKLWDDVAEYMSVVASYKNAGKYEVFIQSLMSGMESYLNNLSLVRLHSYKSLHWAQRHSLNVSNRQLKSIYTEAGDLDVR